MTSSSGTSRTVANDQASRLRQMVEPLSAAANEGPIRVALATIGVCDLASIATVLQRDFAEALPGEWIELRGLEGSMWESMPVSLQPTWANRDDGLIVAFRPSPGELVEVYRVVKRWHHMRPGAPIGLLVDGVVEFGAGLEMARQIHVVSREHLGKDTSYLGEIAGGVNLRRRTGSSEKIAPRVRRSETPIRQRDFAGDRRKRIKSWLETFCATRKLVAVS